MNDADERQPSLEDLLDALSSRRLPESFDLPALSALTNERTDEVALGLKKLDADHRRQLMVRLRDVAQDNGEYEFSSIFRLGLDDDDEEIRLAAVEGLWECEDRWYLRRLQRMVQGDPSVAVRMEAAESLGRFVVLGEFEELSPDEVATLQRLLLARVDDDSESVDVRRAALESIGANSIPEIQAYVRREFESGDHQMRLGAISAMGRSCDSSWIGTLIGELQSDDPELRFEAVQALGQIADPSTTMHIVHALEDEEADVQLAAVSALGDIGGTVAVAQLSGLLKHPDEAMRAAAEAALEEAQFSGDPLGLNSN